MSDTTETTTPKRGRKPNPLTEYYRSWDKAKLKADKARAAHERVAHIAETKREAEAAEQEAYTALQEALAEHAPGPIVDPSTYEDPSVDSE